MHATISNFSSSGFSSLDISAETYDQILKNIYNMGLFLNFSNDYLAYIYMDNRNDFANIPFANKRNLDDAETWIIWIDLRGMIVCEAIDTIKGRTIIDHYSYCSSDYKKGDIVFYKPNNKFYMLLKDADSDGNNIGILLGTDEAYEYNFCGWFPLFHIRKATDYEISALSLKSKFDILYNNYNTMDDDEYYRFIDNYKEQYPWL